MHDVDTPFSVQLAWLLALVVAATLLLRALLPRPDATEGAPATEMLVEDPLEG